MLVVIDHVVMISLSSYVKRGRGAENLLAIVNLYPIFLKTIIFSNSKGQIFLHQVHTYFRRLSHIMNINNNPNRSKKKNTC